MQGRLGDGLLALLLTTQCTLPVQYPGHIQQVCSKGSAAEGVEQESSLIRRDGSRCTSHIADALLSSMCERMCKSIRFQFSTSGHCMKHDMHVKVWQVQDVTKRGAAVRQCTPLNCLALDQDQCIAP